MKQREQEKRKLSLDYMNKLENTQARIQNNQTKPNLPSLFPPNGVFSG